MNKNNGKLIVALSRSLTNIHSKSERLFKEHHLTMSQFAVLEALYHKGECTIKTLITSALSTSGNMTVVIANLEKAGLVKRQSNPNDSRSYLISLTQSGHDLIAVLFEKHMNLVEEKLATLSESEKQQVIHILKKIEKR